MRGLSALGNESFLLVLFPFLYWCLDSRLGLRLAVVYFLSGYLNHALKQALAQPRPADLAPGINLVEQPGHGLPSGHAQGAVVLWGLLAREVARLGAQARCCGAGRWVWVPAVGLMMAIGVSRVYLGVHFPTDVLAGWAIGALVLGAAAWALRLLEARTGASSPARRFPGWFWIPAISLPAAVALALFPQEKNAVAMVAAMWGFLVGHQLRRRFIPGGEEGTVAQRLLRLPAGLAVLLGLYLGLKSLFPDEGQALYLPLRFARYLLSGSWASLGAPLLFRRIGLLARPERPTGSTPAEG